MKQEVLIINPKEIRFEKGFKPRTIRYDDIDSIEYYSETTNGWSTDYYAKFILKNSKPIKKSLYYWKVPYRFDSYIYLKTIIETYYLLNKRKIRHTQQQS